MNIKIRTVQDLYDMICNPSLIHGLEASVRHYYNFNFLLDKMLFIW